MEPAKHIDAAARMAHPYRPSSDVRVAEIERCIAFGLSRSEAEERLSVRPGSLKKQCARLNIKYPRVNPQAKRIWARGRWRTFAEIAADIGVRPGLIRDRHEAGKRDDELYKPSRKTGRAAPKHYWDLGISVAEWRRIVADAGMEGVAATAKKYGIPAGAIQDAIAERWERLG